MRHLFLFAFTLSACLEASPRVADADTGGPEVGVDTEVTDLCAGVDCDDRDGCTVDQCDPNTGACLHFAPPAGEAGAPLPGCVEDAECDDGNACTADACEVFAEGCGVGTRGSCVHRPLLGCGGCASGCDDGDPCTRDTCNGDACTHEALAYCMSGCGSAGAVPLETVVGVTSSGTDVKTVGRLGLGELYRGCNDGPTCDCEGSPAIADGGAELILVPADGAEPLACGSTGCVDVLEKCKPAPAGVRYWVWGTTLSAAELSTAGAAPAEPPPPVAEGLRLADYCLETTDDNLAGDYLATLEVGGIAVEAKAQMVKGTKLTLTLSNPVCASGCPEWVRFGDEPVEVTVGDGFVEVPLAIPGPGVMNTELVRLFSYRHTLRGGYGLQAFQAVAMPYGGHITLTRHARP
jgi:hypothetical protein